MRPGQLRRLALLLALLPALAGTGAHAAPQKVPGGIRFTYRDPGAGTVAWAGEFNGWNAGATPLAKEAEGTWSVTVALPPGEHQYKFVVDGQWLADPENPVTAGDYGNSVVRVGPDGGLQAGRATSNLDISPKIRAGGRFIGLYQASHNDANRRYELRRPNMDIDLAFDTRISDVLQARWLMNINSEAEDVEFYRSRLNFDRGSLLLSQPRFSVLAYDNEDVGTWDDPLHLLGAVGIYRHPFGLGRQGFRVTTPVLGLETELHYADNFRSGGTSYPGLLYFGSNLAQSAVFSLPVLPSGGGYALVPGTRAALVALSISDANEDVLAFRSRRAFGENLKVGLLARTDRGYDLGSFFGVRATGDSTFEVLRGNTDSEWYALGAEVAGRVPGRATWFAEFLRGVSRFNFLAAPGRPGAASWQGRALVLDDLGMSSFQYVGDSLDANGTHLDLDRSLRFKLGGALQLAQGDIVLRGDVEYEGHDYQYLFGDLESSVSSWHLGWDRNWRYYLGREVKTTLDVTLHDFGYQSRTPWTAQLWFDDFNLWLERGEHVVSLDRLVMLGGQDVISLRPRLEVPLGTLGLPFTRWRAGDVRFEYRGTYNTHSLGREPKYAESLFLFGLDVAPQLRLSTDTRWVVYHAPLLELDEGYLDHYVELAYEFAPGIRLALSTGVEPTILDAPLNEYAYIGREQFLYARGANAAEARLNYFGLGDRIAAAERALERERRLQVRADVRF